jgi:hypothetical protein
MTRPEQFAMTLDPRINSVHIAVGLGVLIANSVAPRPFDVASVTPAPPANVTGDGIFGDAFSALGNLAGDTVGAVASVGNTAATAANALPNPAAGTLDGLTGGLSTQIAGRVFGFDPSCADFGTAGRIGAGIAFAANMLTGEGEFGDSRKGGTRPPLGWLPTVRSQPRPSALPRGPAQARIAVPAHATRHAKGPVPAIEGT